MKRLIPKVSAVIKNGGVILYPTESLYGIGGDAYNASVIERIKKIKKREKVKPFLVLAKNFNMVMEQLVNGVSEGALVLMKSFWPGPLTLIFKAKENLPEWMVSPNKTIAVRIEGHQFVQALFQYIDVPLVSTSANISGEPSVWRIEDVKKEIIDTVDFVVTTRFNPSGTPSTILDVSTDVIRVVREGLIRVEKLIHYVDLKV